MMQNKDQLIEEILDGTTEAYLCWDKAGQLLYTNATAKEMFGLEEDGRTGQDKNETLKAIADAARLVAEKQTGHIQEFATGGRIYKGDFKPVANGGVIEKVIVNLAEITEFRNQEKEKELFYSITAATSTNLAIEETLEHAIRQIVKTMALTAGNIMIRDEGAQRLEIVATTDPTKLKKYLQIGEGMAGWVAKTGQPLATAHTKQEKHYAWGNEPDASHLIVPMVSKNKILGVINLYKVAGEYFTESEVQIYSSVASRLAVYLENERLYEEMKNEKNLLALVEKNTDKGLILHDSDGKICFYNPAAREILGLKRSVLGKSWADILKRPREFTELDFVIPKNIITATLQAMAKTQKYKIKLQTRGEIRKIIQGELKSIKEAGQFQNGVVVTIEDLTTMETINEKLALRINQLTQLFKISSLNSTNFEKTIKQTIKSLPNLMNTEKSLFSLYSPKDEEFTTIATSGWGRLKKRLEFEKSSCRRWIIQNERQLMLPQDKSFKDAEILFKNYKVKTLLALPVFCNGECVGILAVANKNNGKNFVQEEANLLAIIASQIQAQLEIRDLIHKSEAEKERIETIITYSADGMTILDKDNRIRLWNAALEELTGYSKGEALGKLADEVILPKEGEFSKIVQDDIKKRSKGRESYHEVELKTKGGEYRWAAIHYSTSPKTEGGWADRVILIHDISRYKALESMKNEFISMTAHELRTPLTAIRGYLSMIMQGDAGELNEKQERYFGRAYKSTERLAGLTEEILNVMRLEEKRLVFQLEPISIRQLTKEVFLDFYLKAAQKNLKLSLENNLKRDELVMADFNRTKQIMANLIDNALKYTPRDGQVTVHLSAQKIEGKPYLVSEIEDNGVGIADENIMNVFSKFQRVNNPLSKQAGGYGLGLFITKSLVEQQGGIIWAESTLGEGSRFSFALPMTKQKVKNIMK